jgi:putative Holliday junction resolvase
MGIDYGEKRIGIALSDENGSFSFAHSVVDNNKNSVKKIKKICEENDVGEIILGKSVDYQGRPNPVMKKIEPFKKLLEKEIGLRVEYQTETLTTKEAERIQGEVKNLDSSAAALILRSFIEKQKMVE